MNKLFSEKNTLIYENCQIQYFYGFFLDGEKISSTMHKWAPTSHKLGHPSRWFHFNRLHKLYHKAISSPPTANQRITFDILFSVDEIGGSPYDRLNLILVLPDVFKMLYSQTESGLFFHKFPISLLRFLNRWNTRRPMFGAIFYPQYNTSLH